MGVEPTKDTALMAGLVSSSSTAVLSPCSTLNTPSGRPASAHSRASHSDALGSFSEGLTTSVLPPLSRCWIPQANSTTSWPRETSPRASESTLPCSAVMIAASSSLRALSNSRKANSTWVRLVSEVSRQAGNAAAAASITTRASSTLASATSPVTAPVAGLVTGAVAPEAPAKTSLSTQWLMVVMNYLLRFVWLWAPSSQAARDGTALVGGALDGFDETAQIGVALLGSVETAALHGQHDVVVCLGQRGHDAFPVDDAIAAGAAQHAAYLAAQSLGVLDTDVFGVHMGHLPDNLLEPLVRVVFAEITVSGVEVDGQRRTVDQFHDLLQPLRGGGVGTVGFDRDLDPPRFSDQGRLLQGVSHQGVVLVLGRPRRGRAIIDHDHRRADFHGVTNGLPQVLDGDVGLGQRGVTGQRGDPQSPIVSGLLEDEGVVEHGSTVEIACGTKKFTPPVHHRLDVLVADLSSAIHRPVEALILQPRELQIQSQLDGAHGCSLLRFRSRACRRTRRETLRVRP